MKKAFTLIEAVIVISILGLLAGLSSLSLVNFGKGSELENARTVVASSLRTAQSNSLANLGDNPWGVHFESDKVVIFQDAGSGFDLNDSTNQTKTLPKGTTVSVNFGGPSDLIFEQNSSSTLTPGTVTLSSTANTNEEIVINAEGMIDY